MDAFVYARVSTLGKTNDDQLLEIEKAGYEVDTAYTDVISGRVPEEDRPEFSKMLDTIERTKKPKGLIVTKLDRLGRNTVDVMSTVETLGDMGCAVRVLQLGDLDPTSSTGKLVMSTLAAVAEMERAVLVERTQAGFERAKQAGTKLGRPRVTDEKTAGQIRSKLADGLTVTEVALRASCLKGDRDAHSGCGLKGNLETRLGH